MKHHSKIFVTLFCTVLAALAIMPGSDVFALGNYHAYDDENEAVAFPINQGGDLGMHLAVTEPLLSFAIRMPTWNSEEGNFATLAVYSWEGSYEASIAKEPLRQKRFECKDNATNTVRFTDDALPAGDYFFRIFDIEGVVGAYGFTKNTKTGGYMFKNGIEAVGELEMTVVLENRTMEPFAPVESTAADYEGGRTAPEEYVIPEDSLIYTHEVMPDTWVFTDALGRTSLTNAEVGDLKDDKTVALFYWTWHTSRVLNMTPVNNQTIIEKYPEEKNNYKSKIWSEAGDCNYWNEPIWGYYLSTDEWVLRKQAELLANAGVDVIFTDNTNGTDTWRESYLKLYETWSKAMEDGVKTPKISFMLPFSASEDTRAQLIELYQDIYVKNKYQHLWYYFDGKPMLLAHSSVLDSSNTLENDILNYFTFRKNIPEYDDDDYTESQSYGSWGWLSMYPQAYYYGDAEAAKANKVEQVTVGVAQNHNYKTHSLSAMNGEYIAGRSYTSDLSHIDETDAKLYGYNFSEQFDYALTLDPEVIFVTGWNEWIAGRYEEWYGVENAFPDQFSDEYSRDLEPSRGELGDNYYYQFVNYVRKYKGARAIPKVSSEKTIDLSQGQEQWETVYPYYAAYIGNTGDRNSLMPGNDTAEEYSGRNDIIGAQISRDGDYLWFNVECREDITPYTDKLWMTLYIDSDQNNQGWCTFDYVINKSAASENTVVLEKFTGDGYNTVKVADCEYVVNGRYMTVKVKKSDIGVSTDYTINFSWTDNVHDADDKGTEENGAVVYTTFSGDILDFYTSGDVAPGGRFKFSYISSNQMTAEEEANQGKSLPQEKTSGSKTGGLWIALGVVACVLTLGAAALVIIMVKKKRKR